jgi:catechol 2,3-dioxygenase-like lactoylglutathione lyase family enzyme
MNVTVTIDAKPARPARPGPMLEVALRAVQATSLAGVLETSLYHDAGGREAIERFYGDLLGLPAVSGWPDGVAFRVGSGVLLLFDRERLAERGGPIADHGTSGPGHVCLLADADGYERWRERLAAAGVEIVHDSDWGGGARSFYFKDPAGNLLEIADRDLWPRPGTESPPSPASAT